MRILVSCGEPSGWLFAGLLEQALAGLAPGLRIIRPGNRGLSESVVGFWEGLRIAPALRRRLNRTVVQVEKMSPDVVVVIGFSGFNLELGVRCRNLGIPVVYLAPPQVWAWGRFRVRTLRKAADKVVCLFRFEEKLLGQAGIDAVFLGYPLLDMVKAALSKEQVLVRLGLSADEKYVVFLPGSRLEETRFHRPLFKRVFCRLRQAVSGIRGVMVALGTRESLNEMAVGLDARYSIIHHAECAVVVSGTACLETALLGTPQVVCYHLSAVSRLLAEVVVRRRQFALPNILLNERVIPELIEPTADRVLAEVLAMLGSPARQEQARRLSTKLGELLGPSGAMERIARLVLEYAQ